MATTNNFPRTLRNIGITSDGVEHDKTILSTNQKAQCGFIRKPEERSWKQKMVAKILVRWWFCMDPWPPKDYNFNEILRKHGYREVAIPNWEEEPERDQNGLRKVYQLQQFKGIYRDSANTHLDFRPQDGCPSYNNLIRKDDKELKEMLVLGLGNQIAALQCNGRKDDLPLIQLLESELRNAKAAVTNYKDRDDGVAESSEDDEPLVARKRPRDEDSDEEEEALAAKKAKEEPVSETSVKEEEPVAPNSPNDDEESESDEDDAPLVPR